MLVRRVCEIRIKNSVMRHGVRREAAREHFGEICVQESDK
jgi:hypothetical protein